MRRLRKLVATLLLSVMSFNIFADGTVVSPGQQATVTIAPNGVPIVNINAPNAGISVTTFQEFNVGANGEVINDADNTGRSYVAGLIPGNPNYGPNQAAQLIILQVNGSNRSTIEGYLEVLSRSKPNVILSNENGITVNGGGTIGIANFTATTGKVNLVDGQYVGINTTDGSLIIGPKGFDGSTADYVNFIAKNIQQSGKVVSSAGLTYIAGANNVSSNGSVAALPSNDASVAIDVSNLGGMYAGVVKVISTSKGAGVNIDGYAVATGGTLEITADGQINVNKVQGKDINIKGTGYTQKDLAYTEGNMNVDAANIILNGTGTQASNINLNGNVTNNADIYTTGTLTTGNLINNSGIQALGNITVNGNLNNTDTLQTNGAVATTGNTLNSGEIYAQSDYSTKNMNNSGILQSGNNVTVTDSLNNSGELQTTNKLNVTGTELKNTGSILADSIGATITTTSNDGKIVGISNINVTSQTLNNTKDILSNGDITLKAQSTNSGVISTNGNVDMSGNKVINNGEIAATNINLNSTNLNNSGSISANGNVELNNSVVDNTKDIVAYDTANMNNSTVNNKGKVISNKEVNLDKSNVTNTGEITSDEINMTNVTGYNNTGTIKGNYTILTTTNDLNLTGTLHGEDYLEIKGNNIANNGGTTGTGYVSITSNDYTNNTELSAEAISINASGNVVNNNMITAKDAEIKANNITNNDLIATEGYLGLIAQGQVINTQGSAIYAGDNLVIKGSEVLNQRADILGQGTIDINASHVKNEVGTIKTLGDIYITSSNFENVGEVTNFDYTTYWVDWQGNEYTDDFIQNNWTELDTWEAGFRDKSYRGVLIEQYKQIHESRTGIKSLLFEMYGDYIRNEVVNNWGEWQNNPSYIMQTDAGAFKTDKQPIEQKIKSNGTTNYATLSAGGNIVIDSDNVLNKDGMITAGDTVQITANRVENVVSLGNPVRLQYGSEIIMTSEFGSGPKYGIGYGLAIGMGALSYISGKPSVIEGNSVMIESPNIVTQAIPEAQGKIITGITTGGTKTLTAQFTPKGISSTISQNGQVEIASNVSSIQVIKDTGTITVDGMSALSAMFTENSNPDSKYLLETRSQYVKLSNYYGSDYFLNNIGYEEEWNRVRRLGDAYYEYQLITKTIQEKLGTSFIDGLSDIELIKYLMDNAKLEAKDKGFVVGQPLTSDQIANLDRDIIWYVYQNVNGVQVLAPQIYLTQEVLANIDVDGRNKIGGKEQTIIKTDNLVNNGTKIGDGGVTYVEAKSIKNQTTTNQLSEISGDNTYVTATDGNIENLGGKIRGTGLVSVVAENGDVINTSTVSTLSYSRNQYNNYKQESIASVGEISSQGTTYIEGNNYTSIGAVTTGSIVDIDVTNNVNIGSIELNSEVKSGGNSKNNGTYRATNNYGSEVIGMEGVSITSGNDVNISGSLVGSNGNTIIKAENDINIKNDVNSVYVESNQKRSGFLSSYKKETRDYTEQAVGSNVVGNNVVLKAGDDVNVQGSNLIGKEDSKGNGGNIYITSGDDVNIIEGTLDESHYSYEKKSGFSTNFSGGLGGVTGGITYSTSKTKQTSEMTNIAVSQVKADGNIVINAGDTVESHATKFKADDMSVVAENDIKLLDAQETYKQDYSNKTTSIGVSVSISSPITSLINTGVNVRNNIKDDSYGFDRQDQSINTLFNGFQDIRDIARDNSIIRETIAGKRKPTDLVDVSIGVNFSTSSTTSHQEGANSVAGTIDVNNLNLTSNNGNVELVNQQVNVAQNMNVKADDFIVRAGKSTFESENSSRSVGAGASFNPLSGAVTPSANYSQSNGNMEGTTYNNSHITVGGNTTINTTGDMILSGADLVTNTIDGNIGGQLIIESLQDTVTGSNDGFGFNMSYTFGGKDPVSNKPKDSKSEPGKPEHTGTETPKPLKPNDNAVTVGGSITEGSVDKDWTSDQSSLIAKNGGTINVGSTTTVTGAVVASENTEKPLIINTTELITKNLEDNDESTNTTVGFSGITSTTPIPKTSLQYDNTDKEQSTLATISNVVVNTGSGQVDLAAAGINTDISKAQEVTKDEETHIDIVIPTDLLNSATWKEFSNQFQQLIATPGDIIEGVQATLSDGSGTTTIDGHKLTTTNLTPYEEIKNNIIGTNAGISCSQSEACKNYEKLVEQYKLPDGTYMNGYINPITNEYVPGITDVAAGALRIILTEAGKGDYAIKFVAAGDTMGQAKINDDTKTMIVNLSKMDITDLEQVTNVGVHESQRFTYENKDTDDKSLNNSDPKDEMYTFTPSIIDPNGIISGDTAWYNSTDLSGYRDKRNEGAEYRKANLLITNRLDGNGSTYNKSEISNQLKSIFGVEIDWIKYSKNEDYREKMNYYFFQAKYTIRLKSVDNFYYDGKTGNTYVTITQDNGKKMTLKELPEKESIFHNVTYKANGDIFIDFSASNLKFVQDDGYELVLKKEGEKYVQVVDQSVKGTYNYYSYGPDSKNIVDKFLNHPVDIKLWELYGGGPSDKSTFDQRKKIEVKALEIALYYDYYKKKYGSKMVNIDDINIF